MKALRKGHDICKSLEVGADGKFSCEEITVPGVPFRLSSHYYVVTGVRAYVIGYRQDPGF